jgi:hypothetical protein
MPKDVPNRAVSLPSSLAASGFLLEERKHFTVLHREADGIAPLWITLCFGKFNMFFLRMLADIAKHYIHDAAGATLMFHGYINRKLTSTFGHYGSLWVSRRYPTVPLLGFIKNGEFEPPVKGGYWIASFQTSSDLYANSEQHIKSRLTASGFVYREMRDRIAFSNLESVSTGFPPGVFDMLRFKPHMFKHFRPHTVAEVPFDPVGEGQVEDYIAKYSEQYCGMIVNPLNYSLFSTGPPEDDSFDPVQKSCESD